VSALSPYAEGTANRKVVPGQKSISAPQTQCRGRTAVSVLEARFSRTPEWLMIHWER
jgi:hypothetical protein